jgi:hypothetical protein
LNKEEVKRDTYMENKETGKRRREEEKEKKKE